MKKAGRKPIDKKIVEEKINNAFNEVCKLVSKGLTIRQALKIININSTWFYKHLSKNQTFELKQIKFLNAIHRKY